MPRAFVHCFFACALACTTAAALAACTDLSRPDGGSADANTDVASDITAADGAAAGDAASADGGGSCACPAPPTMAGDAGVDPGPACTVHFAPGANDQQTVGGMLTELASGSVACFDDGVYHFTDELSIAQARITLRGTGQHAVLDFRNQRATARNGVLVTGANFTIQDLEIKNTPGDGIRVEGVANVTFRRLKVSWDPDGLHPDDAGVQRTGAYAVYPVHCTNVLIEGCEVTGARDAALYVGQSRNVVVRNNYVHGNVAGIEFENTSDGEAYGNYATDNTAGILVFNLPDLPVQDGRRNLIRDNVLCGNNHDNFGVPGTIVASVPPGLGSLVLAASQTEFRNNQINNNNSTGLLILSCYTQNNLMNCMSSVPYYNWPEATYVHGNQFACNGNMPATALSIFPARHPLEDILWDGDVNPDRADAGNAVRTCITDNGMVRFRNVQARMGFAHPITDLTTVQCTQPELPHISL